MRTSIRTGGAAMLAVLCSLSIFRGAQASKFGTVLPDGADEDAYGTSEESE